MFIQILIWMFLITALCETIWLFLMPVSQPKCHVLGGLTSDDKSAIYVKPGRSFQVQCSVEYRGNCSPRTTCRTEDKSVIFNGSENTSADPNKVRTYTSNFTILSNRWTLVTRSIAESSFRAQRRRNRAKWTISTGSHLPSTCQVCPNIHYRPPYTPQIQPNMKLIINYYINY